MVTFLRLACLSIQIAGVNPSSKFFSFKKLYFIHGVEASYVYYNLFL